jgi:hypothetical protein
MSVAVAIPIAIEAAKALAPFALDVLRLLKQRGELTPEQIAELEALNRKTEADYVKAAGGRE